MNDWWQAVMQGYGGWMMLAIAFLISNREDAAINRQLVAVDRMDSDEAKRTVLMSSVHQRIARIEAVVVAIFMLYLADLLGMGFVG